MRRSRAATIVSPTVPDAGWSGPAAPRAGLVGGRKPALPGGRVVLGGLLVAAAAVIVFASAVASTTHHGRSYVVAEQALPAGSILGPGDLTTETMTLPAGTSAQAFPAPAALVGRTVAVPVEAGQLIETSMLAPQGSASSLRPVSVAVATSSLAGLRAGVPVDVLAGGPTGAGSSSSTPSPVTVVLRGATLLSVTTSQLGSAATGATTVVTLGVSDLSEAESLLQAAQAATVVLIQAEPSDGVGPGGPPAG
jgi:Flp pilus assembly protein CpaB